MVDETAVIIVGAGPAGLCLAAGLAFHKIKSIILEKNYEICEDPRSVSINGDPQRIVQVLGITREQLINLGQIMRCISFHTHALSNDPFLSVDMSHDWLGQAISPGRVMLQPRLEQNLRDLVQSNGYSDLRLEWTVTSVSEVDVSSKNHAVIATYERKDGTTAQVKGKFLVGADGKRGYVRKGYLEAKGVEQKVGLFKYQATWIAANIRIHLPTPTSHPTFPLWELGYQPDDIWKAFWPPGFHFCNHENYPTATGSFGPAEDKLWRFNQRVVNHWSHNHVILIGDAAHVFPPFAGQGMSNGIRDAFALAWRLALFCDPDLGGGGGGSNHPLPKVKETLECWARERRTGVDASTLETKRNGDLLLNRSSSLATLIGYGHWLFGLAPSIRDSLLQKMFRDDQGFTGTQNGFFLPKNQGGRKLAQVYVVVDEDEDEDDDNDKIDGTKNNKNKKTRSVHLSDPFLCKPRIVLTLLILEPPSITEQEGREIERIIQAEKLPSYFVSREVVQFSQEKDTDIYADRACKTTKTTKSLLRPPLQVTKLFLADPKTITNAGLEVIPSYDPMQLRKRFASTNRFVWIRSDLVVFSEACTTAQLEEQLHMAWDLFLS